MNPGSLSLKEKHNNGKKQRNVCELTFFFVILVLADKAMLKCVLKCSTTAGRTFENRGHWHCPYCFQICERKNAMKIVENQPGPYSYPSLNLVAFLFREDNYWCSTPSFGPDWKSVWKKGKIFHHCENPRYILYVSNLYYTCWARTRRKADQRKKNF